MEEDRGNEMMADKDIDLFASEDTFVSNDEDNLNEMLCDEKEDFSSDREHKNFLRMVEDHKTEVFLGYKKEHNKLHIILTLLRLPIRCP